MQAPSSLPTQGWHVHYGLELIDASVDEPRGRVTVGEQHKQPMGLVDGGVFASIAENLTSYATHFAVAADNSFAVGVSNNTSFLRPITGGHINAVARPRHRGRTTWVWDVEMSDDDGRLCAIARTTVAVRPVPDSGAS